MAQHFLLLLSIAIPCSGFNLSPEASILFEDPKLDHPGWRESYFGYAVGLRSRKYHKDTWLLVGAPRGNATSFRAPVGINEPGLLYKCPLGTGGGCEELVVDQYGNTAHNLADGERAYRDLKDGGWLGGSIDTQDSDRESSMVCAPLWKNQFYKGNYLLNGACYVQDSEFEHGTALKRLPLTKFSLQNYRISRRSDNVFFHYAHGQLGMNIHFPENMETVLVGAPGIFNWHGSVVEMKDPESLVPGNISKRKRRQLLSPIQYYSGSFIPNPHFTSSLGDNNYFGYSVSSGRFVSDEIHYIAGAPRGANSTGKVLVFQMGSVEESELDILVERNGQQIGEYFGAAVTAVDFNGDGLDELVVGAPFKSQASVPDHGMVYVYNNLGLGQINVEATRLVGSLQPMARFGSVVMSPGDLDMDGFKDLIVGAPYEGPGAIYVYLGSPDGVSQRPSQRISAEGVTGPSKKPLSGFGISISRGVDIDDNQYRDVAVGSYSSGHVMVIRSRPVAILEGSTSTIPTKLAYSAKNFEIKACVKYSGRGVPETELVTVHMTLDHERQQPVPRATFMNSGSGTDTYNITLSRGSRKCDVHRVRIESELNNAKDPIGIRLQFWLADSSLSESEKTLFIPGSPTAKLGPVTSPVTRPSQRKGVSNFISITTGCEEDGDDTCRSDLRVQASYPGYGGDNRLIIGKQKRVTLAVKVQNHGEPAFLPNITFAVRRPLDLLLPTTHTCERLGTSYPSVACRLNNPLVQGKEDNIEIEVDVEQMTDASPPVTVNVTTGSSDIEVTPADNFFNSPLQVGADIRLQLYGSSMEEQVSYARASSTKLNTTVSQTLSFVHTHTLVKKGPTPAGLIRLTIEIPVRDSENNTLLTVHAPERNFRGQVFPCYLEGAEWESAEAGQSINYTDIPDGPQNLDQTFRRQKRQVKEEETLTISDEDQEELLKRPVPHLNCREVLGIQCAFLKCDISSWPHDSSSATIKFRLDLNLTTLAKIITVKDGTVLSTDATATVASLGEFVQFSQQRFAKGTARTSLLPGYLPHEGISWWWYVLAVVIGLLLLSALIYGLHKMGFFRRKEQEEMQSMTATVTQQDDS